MVTTRRRSTLRWCTFLACFGVSACSPRRRSSSPREESARGEGAPVPVSPRPTKAAPTPAKSSGASSALLRIARSPSPSPGTIRWYTTAGQRVAHGRGRPTTKARTTAPAPIAPTLESARSPADSAPPLLRRLLQSLRRPGPPPPLPRDERRHQIIGPPQPRRQRLPTFQERDGQVPRKQLLRLRLPGPRLPERRLHHDLRHRLRSGRARARLQRRRLRPEHRARSDLARCVVHDVRRPLHRRAHRVGRHRRGRELPNHGRARRIERSAHPPDRQVASSLRISSVPPCVNTALPDGTLTLPKNGSEGDSANRDLDREQRLDRVPIESHRHRPRGVRAGRGHGGPHSHLQRRRRRARHEPARARRVHVALGLRGARDAVRHDHPLLRGPLARATEPAAPLRLRRRGRARARRALALRVAQHRPVRRGEPRRMDERPAPRSERLGHDRHDDDRPAVRPRRGVL